MRAMCGAQLRDIKIAKKVMLSLDETINWLAMANSVCCNGHVLRREYGHVLRRALVTEVECQWMKGRLKVTWKKQVEEESMKIGLRMEDALCRSRRCVGVRMIAAGLWSRVTS